MAKTSAIQRNLKRIKLAKRYEKKRAALKKIIKNKKLELSERFAAQLKLIRLPKNSSKDLMNDIVDLANQNKGDHAFVVHIPSSDGQERKIISKKIKVSNNNQFLILLRDLLGDSNVWIA